MSKKRFQLLSDAHWELIALLLPEPNLRRDKRGVGVEPGLPGAESVGLADGRGVAALALQVPLSSDLMEEFEAVGGATSLAGRMACAAGRAGSRRSVEVGRRRSWTVDSLRRKRGLRSL